MLSGLGKKLKDAGFESEKGCGHCGYDAFDHDPTLEELIEACGGESVLILTIGKVRSTVVHGVTGIVSEARTPTEAVAQLYLTLNRKNKD